MTAQLAGSGVVGWEVAGERAMMTTSSVAVARVSVVLVEAGRTEAAGHRR
jgi:hypothetical protein